MRTLPPGTTIGPYAVEAEVARGAMGAVYRARRVQDGAVVALKVLSAGPGATESQLERFRREGELAARLTHPGIVRVHDAGSISWLSYIAMDLIEGPSLAESVGRLAPLEAARLVAQVARAVEYAHANGVVHRDLKPGNVLVRRHDARALVTDFGIARDLAASALTRTGAMVGTPTYFSPEQAAGRPVTSASDVHALGVLLFETVTGVPPFRRDDLPSMLLAIADEVPEPPSSIMNGVPAALDRVCRAALQKAPEARPTAGEVADALEALVAGRAAPRLGRRRPVVGVALGAIALVVTAGALAVATSSRSDPDAATAPVAPATAAPRMRPAKPPPEPAWVEPVWLRGLVARRDTRSLLDAHAALDAAPQVDARTRARAVEVLSAMDASWRAPDGRAAQSEALDLLLWMHWLWKRVDPSHELSPERRRRVDESAGWAFGQQRDRDYLPRVGRAAVALTPEELNGYLIYASASDHEHWSIRDGELLRKGAALASATRNPAWGAIAKRYVVWLTGVAHEAEPERASAAKAALLELCHHTSAKDGELHPEAAMEILIRGAEFELGGPAQADAFLLRAEALAGPMREISMHRAWRLAGRATDPTSLAAAAAEADRAVELLTSKTRSCAPREVAQTGALAFDLWTRAGQRPRALAAVERVLAAFDGQPGLAARRLEVLLDDPASSEFTLAAALADLTLRLDAELARRGRADARFLEGALNVVRAATTAPPVRPRFEASLRRLTEEKALGQLDPAD